MFDKFQDALVVLVFFYMVYRVGWGSGMTGINTFMLRCRGADIDRSEAHGIPGPDEGKEAGRGAETGRREKGSEIGVSSLMLPCRRVFAIDLCL